MFLPDYLTLGFMLSYDRAATAIVAGTPIAGGQANATTGDHATATVPTKTLAASQNPPPCNSIASFSVISQNPYTLFFFITIKKGHNETLCIIATELSMLICLRLPALRPYISISLPL